MNVDEVAAELYEARIAKGLSPRDLERMTGVSDDSIARFELGQVRPRLDTVVLVAEALGWELLVRPKRTRR